MTANSVHLALARKWRPQRFEDVIGQRGVVDTLKNAIASGRLAQSFIFAGPRGVGKTTTARILARALNCEHGPTGEPCGTCDACRRDRRRPRRGRPRNRRRHLHRRRCRPRGHRRTALDRADARPLQDLHHRRSPPPLEERVRRAAEVDRRTAAVREVHDGDDRSAERAGHDQVAVAGLRAQGPAVRRHSRAAAIGGTTNEAVDDRRRRRWRCVARAAEGSMRDGLSALDQILAFATDTVTDGRRQPRCSASSAATCSSTSSRPSRARMWPARSRWRARSSRAASTCASSAASWRG